jgi:hypothetical protein
MEVAPCLHSIGLGDRILTNRLQYQTACLRGPVPVVEQALELRIKLELDVLVTVRLFFTWWIIPVTAMHFSTAESR